MRLGIMENVEEFKKNMEKIMGVSPLMQPGMNFNLATGTGIKIDKTDEETTIFVDLPGAVKEKIDVTVDKNKISVIAHATTGKSIKKNIFLKEKVDEKRVKAAYSNGILTIKLAQTPKKKIKME